MQRAKSIRFREEQEYIYSQKSQDNIRRGQKSAVYNKEEEQNRQKSQKPHSPPKNSKELELILEYKKLKS